MRTAASILAAAALAAATPAQLAEPWEQRYDGGDASGDQVIALWSFDHDAATADRSGNGHVLTLAGARLAVEGRFGGALASARGWPVADERHAATAADHDALSPRGAFTVELWLRPDAELSEYGHTYLIDKKYVSHDDYQLLLDAPDRTGRRRLRASLGFGASSETYRSHPVEYAADRWYHVAVTYDGAGTLRFFRDGTPLGGATRATRGSVSPGARPLSIGDRLGSYYHGFPGKIDEVRITRAAREFASVHVEHTGPRSCFLRMEPQPTLTLRLTNLRRAPLAAATVKLHVHGTPAVVQPIPTLAAGASHEIRYPVDSSLRPDRYQLAVVVQAKDRTAHRAAVAVTIVSRPLPHRMPVVMWGLGGIDPTRRAIPRLKSLGFTHAFGLSVDHSRIWKHGVSTALPAAQLRASYALLDDALEHDLGVLIKLSPGRWASREPELRRIARDGSPRPRRDVCATSPRLQQFCSDVGTSVAQTWGAFPAFSGAMIHTEVRDGAEPCFHDHDRAAFRAHAGFDIPALVDTKRGVDWRQLREFPADRVVEADDPLLAYFRWYWRSGDGWNDLTTAVHQGLAASSRDDFWTFTDPAARVASIYGSGGEVDVLSHWTYTYPDPIRIGMATDTLLRMVQGAGHKQRAMKMTQLIWYRSQTAPAPDPAATANPAAPPTTPRRPAAPPAEWEDRDPDAAYLTCSPMQLREAFWAKISRPISGIMYHGWGALVPTKDDTAYRLTHPGTGRELQRLVRTVVEPLGPTLLQVDAAPTDVAFLESFASQVYAGRGSFGWATRWSGDSYHAAMYAGLQPDIVYDETIAKQGLDGYRVLFMTSCDVLSRDVVERVKAFQLAGGLVVGDGKLAAIEPDITLPRSKRTGRGDSDKARVLRTAELLRAELAGRYPRYLGSTNAEVVSYRRRYQDTDYVFLINDRREFGNYVGHHGMVMENGLPAQTTLTVRRQSGVVYDLVEGCAVPTTATEDHRLSIDLALDPGAGRLLMITPQPIAAVDVQAPISVQRGAAAKCVVTVTDPAGLPVDAVVPVRLEILDPDGRTAEGSGYYGAAGRIEVDLQIAPNDVPGVWLVRVRELASGRTGRRAIRVVR